MGRYSQRYFDTGSTQRPHREQPAENFGSRSFKLRPVKPISEIGATDVPKGKVPQVPARRKGDSGFNFDGDAQPFPGAANGNGRKSNVSRALYLDTPATRKTRSIRQINQQQPVANPFGPVARPLPAKNPFLTKPPTPVKSKPTLPPVNAKPLRKSATPFDQTGFPDNKRLRGGKTPTLSATPNAPRTPMLTMRWIKQSDINVGQKCRFDLEVKNGGMHEAKYVSVEVALPSTVRLSNSKPTPTTSKSRAMWKFDSIPAGEKRTIQLTVIPSSAGDIKMNAAVRFTGLTPALFTVNKPELKIAFIGPEKVLVGDPAPQIIEISNPGTGIAKSVAIEAVIPKGLQHPRGKRLAMDIGALNPGETRKVRLTLKAIESGKQVIQIKATGDAALGATRIQTVAVSAPSLKVAMKGPGLRYVGRNALYEITVTNDGSIATNNVRVLHRLPEGMRFLKADKGGSYTYSKRTIGWFVGRLEPGNSVTVKAIASCTEIGKKVHLAGALSEQGTKAQATHTTKVDGIASLAVAIINPDDPVEVGAATTYEIRVRNKGTKADANIILTCNLPAGMKLLAAKGVTRSAAAPGKVVFAPLKSLPPGKTAIYRVQVRGTTAGNQRFRASIRSSSMKESLSYAKLTRFYTD